MTNKTHFYELSEENIALLNFFYGYCLGNDDENKIKFAVGNFGTIVTKLNLKQKEYRENEY